MVLMNCFISSLLTHKWGRLHVGSLLAVRKVEQIIMIHSSWRLSANLSPKTSIIRNQRFSLVTQSPDCVCKYLCAKEMLKNYENVIKEMENKIIC